MWYVDIVWEKQMFRKENFEICKTSQNFVKSFKSPIKCKALKGQ